MDAKIASNIKPRSSFNKTGAGKSGFHTTTSQDTSTFEIILRCFSGEINICGRLHNPLIKGVRFLFNAETLSQTLINKSKNSK